MEMSRAPFFVVVVVCALLIQHSPVLAANWCIPKLDTAANILQGNVDFGCGPGKVDCNPIKAGGACFEPSNGWAHAAYVMNAFYQSTGQKDCDFQGSGIVVTVDPRVGGCFKKPATIAPPQTQKQWCVVQPNTNVDRLNTNRQYACNYVDCKDILPGGICYNNENPYTRAIYAMNLFYRAKGDCNFAGTGVVTTQNPSFDRCVFP